MARKPPRQNPIREFVKETLRCGREPHVVTSTLPDGTVRTEMRATEIPQQADQEDNKWDAAVQ